MKRIYRYPDLRARGIPYTDQHLRRLEAAGKFPRRRKLTHNSGPQGAVGWDADEVDAHIEAIFAEDKAA